MTAPELPDLAEIDAHIAEIQAELRQCGPDHPDHGMLLYQLGICEGARFAVTSAEAYLDAAVSHLEAAVAAIPRNRPDYPEAWMALSSHLTERFQRTGRPADEQAAIAAAQAAIDAARATETSSRAEVLAGGLGSLGAALQARYQRTGVFDDLNEAISHYQAALDVDGSPREGRKLILGNLAGALRMRFELVGDPADLEAAIESGQAAVAETPPGHLYRELYLSNLGAALLRRFQRRGALRDADDAVTALRTAVAAMTPGNPNYAGVQSNLALVQLGRFGRTGAAADLDDAVAASRVAVGAGNRDDPRYAGMAQSAASALFRRYERDGHPADLDAAIDMARLSGTVIAPDSPHSVGPLTALAAMLDARFQRGADPADLDAAIQVSYQAVHATSDDHLWRANALLNLGIVLRRRFELTGLRADHDAALAKMTAASEVATAWTSVRVRAAALLGVLADDDPALAARALADAVRLLPEVASRYLRRGDQQHVIGELAGMASAAASAALADPSVPVADRPARALALLEASRAVLFSQALDTRDDLTDLRRERSDLADQFVYLRDQLDQPDPAASLPGDSLTALGTQAAERERLEQEFTTTLAAIRALNGFAGFGLPPSLDELCAEAARGPVVTFTVSARGGGALLLTAGGVSYLDLPGLTDDAVTAQVNAFRDAVVEAGSDDVATAEAAKRTLTAILGWLWNTAAGPALGALGYRARPAAGQPWPHVWWVPGGKLGQLPVHAAGHHDQPCEPGESAASVLDAVISSYTPTVRALRYARQQAWHRDGPSRALVVAMPVTPGQHSKLPGVAAEVEAVCAVLPAPIVLAEPDDGAGQALPDNLPTRANVLRYLPACTIAHFACHADSDATDPSRSLLLLHDHETAPLTVAALALVDHERLELTYLSACSTALTAATNLADEAIHLTSAFQLAGSRHVIGTLWPANDRVALRVARSFYDGLRGGEGTVDTDRAAVALHDTVRRMRDRWPSDPSLWAPYLHAGA